MPNGLCHSPLVFVRLGTPYVVTAGEVLATFGSLGRPSAPTEVSRHSAALACSPGVSEPEPSTSDDEKRRDQH